MLRQLDLRDQAGELLIDDYRRLVPRAAFDVDAALDVVRPICADVRDHGVEALTRYSEQFDHVVPDSFRVSRAELDQAEAGLDPELRAAFETSIERRRRVAETERGEERRSVELAPGARVEQRMLPVGRVGLYVPGGLAPLASSVIMNVVPAQAAGVESLALASPPQRDFGGRPHPNVLALCAILGVDEVYAVGGAQAIAMFGHGVPDLCPRVDLITGPGNIYVAAAKRLLQGQVGIDSEAGTTEIAILADRTADPRFVAADLISQAEHDPNAAAVLVTDSTELIEATSAEVEVQVAGAKHGDRIRTALSGPQSAMIIVRDLDQGLDVINAYAAEHLELHTADPASVATRVRNAGAIFLGPYAPVSLGDYSAGSTHVLPTGGCACHASGLNVQSFLKAVHVIDYDAAALAEIGAGVQIFAEAEDLPGHGAAVAVRLTDESDPLDGAGR